VYQNEQQRKKDARKLYGMGGSKMTKKQKDHRMGGSKMTKKQKDHGMGGSKMNKTQKKSQFGGDDPKRINWRKVLKQVVMDNKGPMMVAEIISKVQTYAETNGKTVPTAANIRQKFKTNKGKNCCAWVGKMFKIKRSKVKRDCVVSLKGRPK
jgi:hypothetical protein